MKIKPKATTTAAQPTSAPAKKAAVQTPSKSASVAKAGGWGPTSSAHKALSSLASQAAARVMSETPAGKPVTHQHPVLEKFGEGLGMALGVIVTEALALLPSANKALLDSKGKPVEHIEGADRIGSHDILARHQEVVGPKILEFVKTLPAGAVHDLLEGLGVGATKAPGESYRLESALADLFQK